MQIRTKITLYFISITASLLLVAFASIYFLTANERRIEFHKHIVSKAITRAIYRIKLKTINSSLLKTLDIHKQDLLDYENISIYNQHNKKIYTNNQTYDFAYLFDNLKVTLDQVRSVKQITYVIHSIEIVGQTYNYDGQTYVLLVGAKDTIGFHQLQKLRLNLLYIFICVLTFLGVSGWLFSKRILKPISDVMNEVDDLSVANLSSRLKEENKKDEISRLIHTFNGLLDRLEKSFQIQRAFISHASHELLNPLTSITSQIEVSLLSERQKEEYIELLQSVLEDIKRLSMISEQLIKLSKYANMREKVGFKMLRIDELVWHIRQEFLKKHQDATVQFRIDSLPENAEQLEIYGNDTLLETCFHNLIENGIKYSYDKKVEVVLFVDKSELVLQFINAGEGITEKDLINLFTPFYRAKSAVSVQGFGLGLSIVKNILDLHQIQIQVQSIAKQTTTFELRFAFI
jgi:signal transduction histidine kinase